MRPTGNSGKKATRHDPQRQPTLLRQRTLLNYVIYHDKTPAELLSDRCNWTCIDAPQIDKASRTLVDL